MDKIYNIELYQKNDIIDITSEILQINYLVEPLTMIPQNIKKIVINNSYNVFRRQHVIPQDCELVIHQTIITNYIPIVSYDFLYPETCVFPKLNLNILDDMNDNDFSEITHLFIKNNYILPYEKFNNLRSLSIKDTDMTNIPEDIKKLNTLQILCIYNSKLTIIPTWISELSELTDISFSNNIISSIPENICLLTKLTRLNLSKNQITVIPDTLKNKTLKYLMLDFNPILPMII
jgi:Leucine-rich repeat (LRR) protein